MEALTRSPATRARGSEVGLAAWFIGLRWIAAASAAIVIILATVGMQRVPPGAARSLWVGVALLGAFNALLGAIGARRLSSPRALSVQIAGDVALLGWLTHQAGGVDNPFAGFFVLLAAIACVVLEPGRARVVAGAIALFVAAQTIVETTGVWPAGCVLDRQGVCHGADDWPRHLAAGAALCLMILVCVPILIAVIRALHAERERLVEAGAVLSARSAETVAARAQAQAERERLQTIIDCMADAVVFVAPDGRVRLRNAAAARLWEGGTSRAGEANELRACHSPEAWDKVLAKVLQPAPVELHPIIPVGSHRYEASYAPVAERDGSLCGVVMVARDVTERIEAQSWRMDEERMAVVGKLAAGLAHELNNPLGAIALFTQHALEEVPRGTPLSEHLGTVLRNAMLCTRILRDLLEYARRRPPERGDVPLAELLGDVARTLESHAQAARVTLRDESADSAGEVIYGDPDQLRQVLVNLGLNAIEAMPEGGALTLRAGHGAAGWPRISVIDTGVGIEAGEIERVFAAFHTTKPEGTGLGLTVARDIVTAHRGRIEIESEPGEGSAFHVLLPPRDAARPMELPS